MEKAMQETTYRESPEMARSIAMATAKSRAAHFSMLDDVQAVATWKQYYQELEDLLQHKDWPQVEFPKEPAECQAAVAATKIQKINPLLNVNYVHTEDTAMYIVASTDVSTEFWMNHELVSIGTNHSILLTSGAAWKIVSSADAEILLVKGWAA